MDEIIPEEQPMSQPQAPLPNATICFVLGILSVVSVFLNDLISLALGVIVIVLAKKDEALYAASSSKYPIESWRNSQAGKH
jgi:hypothetical protein